MLVGKLRLACSAGNKSGLVTRTGSGWDKPDARIYLVQSSYLECATTSFACRVLSLQTRGAILAGSAFVRSVISDGIRSECARVGVFYWQRPPVNVVPVLPWVRVLRSKGSRALCSRVQSEP